MADTEIPIGTRVFVLTPIGDRVQGFGTYEGDFPRIYTQEEVDAYVQGFGLSEEEACSALSRPNARIRMDDSSTMWGCECWWGAAKGSDYETQDPNYGDNVWAEARV